MTEAEWLASADPGRMLAFLRGKASARKLRLFAVACCRRVEHLLVDECRAALEVAGHFADGRATAGHRRAARACALSAGWVGPPDHPAVLVSHARGSAKSCVCYALAASRYEAASGAAGKGEFSAAIYEWNRLHVSGSRAAGEAWKEQYEGLFEAERAAQAGWLRDIFGNPFRAVTLDAGRLPASVTALARTLYDDGVLRRMPELGDAMEEAGCVDVDVLAHCRAPAQHLRGCWVLDLVLGRS